MKSYWLMIDQWVSKCRGRITLALWINDPQAPQEADRVTNDGSGWKMELSEFGGMTGCTIVGRCPESLRLE